MPTRARGRAPKPIESFGPEILQALIEGSKREINITLPYRKAVYFRSRVNALRYEMRAQKHHLYPVVSQATVRIVWDKDVTEKKSPTNVRFPANKDTSVKLIISPADAEFSEALKAAGIEVKPLDTELLPNTETAESTADVLSEYLKENPV